MLDLDPAIRAEARVVDQLHALADVAPDGALKQAVREIAEAWDEEHYDALKNLVEEQSMKLTLLRIASAHERQRIRELGGNPDE